MPELPEVEAARRIAAAVAVGHRIASVTAVDDPIVFEGVPPALIRRALLGRRVRAVRRHGKHFWLSPWLPHPPRKTRCCTRILTGHSPWS